MRHAVLGSFISLYITSRVHSITVSSFLVNVQPRCNYCATIKIYISISPPLSLAGDSSIDLSTFEPGGVKEVAQCSRHNKVIRSRVPLVKNVKL